MTPDDATPRAMTAEESVRAVVNNPDKWSPLSPWVYPKDAVCIAEAHAAAATAELRAQVEALQHERDQVCVALGEACQPWEIVERIAAIENNLNRFMAKCVVAESERDEARAAKTEAQQ